MDKQEKREYDKKYYQENKEALKANSKEYYQENKEASAAYGKEYRQENKEALAAKGKEYRQENKEALAAYYKKYRQENKEALATWHKKWRQENKKAISAQKKKYYQENLGAKLWSAARNRAKKKGLEFSLDKQKVVDTIAHGYCEVTGLPFSKETYTGRYYTRRPFTPSLDRIDSELGYTDDNCHIVVACYNLAKNQWHRQDVIRMSIALIKHQHERNQS